MFCDFLGSCEKRLLFKSNWLGLFLGQLLEDLGYFLIQHLVPLFRSVKNTSFLPTRCIDRSDSGQKYLFVIGY